MAASEIATKVLAPGSKLKLGLQIAAVIVLGVVVYKIVKKTDQYFDDQSNRDENQSTANELEKLNKNPATRQKITDSQAQGYANSIYASMGGLGTDEQAIKDIFYHLKNDADFLALKKFFGTRTVWSGTPFFVSDIRGTLIPLLRNELSAYWIGLINDILKAKKIKYRV
jgi:hypothetical protein